MILYSDSLSQGQFNVYVSASVCHSLGAVVCQIPLYSFVYKGIGFIILVMKIETTKIRSFIQKLNITNIMRTYLMHDMPTTNTHLY